MNELQRTYIRFDYLQAQTFQTSGDRITCHKGCSACCSEPIWVFGLEAKAAIKAIPPDELSGVVERTRQWAAKAAASGILKEKEPHVLAYRKVGLTCPLLKDNLCLVYNQRPIGCRSHCAIGDSKLCGSDDTRLQQTFAWARGLTHKTCMVIMSQVKPPYTGAHLGVFLAEKLLNLKLESNASLEINIKESPEHSDYNRSPASIYAGRVLTDV